jgi:repressor LexA
MPTPLTKRQGEVLDFMRRHIAKHGYCPSIREIGTHFGMTSPNGVICHLKALEQKGKLKRCRGKNGRAIARAFVLAD